MLHSAEPEDPLSIPSSTPFITSCPLSFKAIFVGIHSSLHSSICLPLPHPLPPVLEVITILTFVVHVSLFFFRDLFAVYTSLNVID